MKEKREIFVVNQLLVIYYCNRWIFVFVFEFVFCNQPRLGGKEDSRVLTSLRVGDGNEDKTD
jgi:hypothetical protein